MNNSLSSMTHFRVQQSAAGPQFFSHYPPWPPGLTFAASAVGSSIRALTAVVFDNLLCGLFIYWFIQIKKFMPAIWRNSRLDKQFLKWIQNQIYTRACCICLPWRHLVFNCVCGHLWGVCLSNLSHSGRNLCSPFPCQPCAPRAVWVFGLREARRMMVAVAICCILVLLAVFIILIIFMGQNVQSPAS